jgi:hypothetical protein
VKTLNNLKQTTDTQIDRLVYQLYLPAPRAARQAGGRTDKEIQIVEEAV